MPHTLKPLYLLFWIYNSLDIQRHANLLERACIALSVATLLSRNYTIVEALVKNISRQWSTTATLCFPTWKLYLRRMVKYTILNNCLGLVLGSWINTMSDLFSYLHVHVGLLRVSCDWSYPLRVITRRARNTRRPILILSTVSTSSVLISWSSFRATSFSDN